MAEKKQKILIVDDDKFLLDMYAMKFTENDFNVSVAMNGEDALTKLSTDFTPDICLVDVIMPGMDGFSLISAIKEKNLDKGATIIILSNLGQKEDVERGLKVGADGYIIKASATPSEVVAKVLEITKAKR